MMRIIIAGLGSIGCRHLRDIDSLLRERGIDCEIDALRSGNSPLPDNIAGLLTHSFTDKSQLTGKYDIGLVCDPTFKHIETCSILTDFVSNLFVEKPIATTDLPPELLHKLNSLHLCHVACPLRFSPVLGEIQSILPELSVHSARAICSSFLPEWRVRGDYRDSYSARKLLGGGVELDLIHEWDYIVWLFSSPKRVKAFSGHYSELEIDSNDLALYLAEYDDKIISISLDYFSRVPRRQLELLCTNCRVTADLLSDEVIIMRPGEQDEHRCFYGHEDLRKIEMRCFIDSCLSESPVWLNPPDMAIEVLKMAKIG